MTVQTFQKTQETSSGDMAQRVAALLVDVGVTRVRTMAWPS